MQPRVPSPPSGFTLLEVLLAVAITAMVMAVGVPCVAGALEKPRPQRAFEQFDTMVRSAGERAVKEKRNYVIVWGKDDMVTMRPETPTNRQEAGGLLTWDQRRAGALELRLPAALHDGEPPAAIWTFWADGACEPAEVRCTGEGGGWKALYHPMTTRAEVRYE